MGKKGKGHYSPVTPNLQPLVPKQVICCVGLSLWDHGLSLLGPYEGFYQGKIEGVDLSLSKMNQPTPAAPPWDHGSGLL